MNQQLNHHSNHFKTQLLLVGKWLLQLIVLLSYSKAYTQVLSIDQFDTAAYSNKSKWNYRLSTGLEIDKQQQVLYDASNTADISFQKNKQLTIFSGSYRFTYNGPTDILNAGYFHLRFRYNYKNAFQPESFVQYQWDNKRGLEKRFLVGGNIRYNAWHGQDWDLNAGLGCMLENEWWNYSAVDSSHLPINLSSVNNTVLKLNSYFRIDWNANANSHLIFKVFVQNGFAKLAPRIAPYFQWNIDAGKHLGFSVNFNGMYDVAPVVPINHFYYSFSNNIYYKL